MNAYSATLPTFKERITLLYVLNDVFFHASSTYDDTKRFMIPATTKYLGPLLASVKSVPAADTKQLDTLLRLWQEKKYFPPDVFTTITGGNLFSSPAKPTRLQRPGTLGNINDPYYLLPVSCMLEAIVAPPNRNFLT
jgi:CID domain